MPDRPAPGAQLPLRTVALRYRSLDGRDVLLTLPAPAAPALVRTLDAALAKNGFARVDES